MHTGQVFDGVYMKRYVRIKNLIDALEWEPDNEVWEISDEKLNQLMSDAVCFDSSSHQKESNPSNGINAEELYERFVKHINSMSHEELIESARHAAEMTAGCDDDFSDDLVEVVRCKDCKHAISYIDPLEDESGLRCPLWGATGINPDGFCHNGKR